MGAARNEKTKAEDTKHEEVEPVGLEGLLVDENKDDAPSPEETRTPFDEA